MRNISESMEALVCDLDGVLYRGDDPVPGAARALERLRRRGIALVFCTNNSASTLDDYVVKLGVHGVRATSNEIVTSGVVLQEVLEERGWAGRSAFAIGGAGVIEALEGAGARIVRDEEAYSADLVVVGWDRTFTWDKMRIASTAIANGAYLIATNEDATFPAAEGLWPGAGSILASVERATGARAEVLGKPHRPMMEAVQRRLKGVTGVVMVGDRDDTDLDGARAMGWGSILVLSGVTTRAEAEALDPVPDLVLDSLADLQ